MPRPTSRAMIAAAPSATPAQTILRSRGPPAGAPSPTMRRMADADSTMVASEAGGMGIVRAPWAAPAGAGRPGPGGTGLAGAGAAGAAAPTPLTVAVAALFGFDGAADAGAA